MTVVVDDHLLGDILGGMVPAELSVLLRRHQAATTNLYRYRLCRAALAASGGALTGSWSAERRREAVSALVGQSPDVQIMAMADLTVRMAELAKAFGLSALGAEAAAASEALGGRLCVWDGDVGPRLRTCCQSIGVEYRPIAR